MKYSFCLISICAVLATGLWGCESDPEAQPSPQPQKTAFELACTESGGTVAESGACVCNGISCANGILCNTVTKACAFTPECEGTWKKCTLQPDGIGYRQECNNGILSSETACPGNAACADDTKCEELGTAPCSSEGEHVCSNGLIKICVNGKYTEERSCPGGVGCKDASQCEATSSDACDGTIKAECIEIDGIGSKRTCIEGSWSQYSACPGGACNADHSDCRVENAEACTSDACSDGQIRRCIAGSYSDAQSCQISNGCKALTECGDCKYHSPSDMDSVCLDNENGCTYQQCTDKFVWSSIDDNEAFSCKNAHEVGVCRNGYYHLTRGGSDKTSIIQTCQDGVWPLDDPESTSDWIAHEKNDALFRHAVTCKNVSGGSEVHFYSNYSKDIYVKSDMDCASLTGDNAKFTVPKSNSILLGDENYKFLGEFLEGFYGVKAYDDTSWFLNGSIYRWFNCGRKNCASVSFCADVAVLTASNINFTSSPYLVSIIDNRYKQDAPYYVEFQFSKANGECNSNRTGLHHAECSKHAIDMLHRFEGASVSAECLTDPICQKESIEFDICKFGASRTVKCQTKANGDYSCAFGAPNISFDTDVVCVDFYDKTNHHYAYRFAQVDQANMASVSYNGKITECKVGASGQAECPAISKCATNRCNKTWTGCSDEPEVK